MHRVHFAVLHDLRIYKKALARLVSESPVLTPKTGLPEGDSGNDPFRKEVEAQFLHKDEIFRLIEEYRSYTSHATIRGYEILQYSGVKDCATEYIEKLPSFVFRKHDWEIVHKLGELRTKASAKYEIAKPKLQSASQTLGMVLSWPLILIFVVIASPFLAIGYYWSKIKKLVESGLCLVFPEQDLKPLSLKGSSQGSNT